MQVQIANPIKVNMFCRECRSSSGLAKGLLKILWSGYKKCHFYLVSSPTCRCNSVIYSIYHLRYTLQDLIDFADSEDLPAADALLQDDQLLDINLGSPERPQGSTARREGSPEPMKSPGKYWSVSETLDTPEGIKMKINRKKKPNQVGKAKTSRSVSVYIACTILL